MANPRLAVFNTQPPHLYFGGVERRILETAKRLKNDIEITVYSGTKAGFKKSVDLDGARVQPIFSTDKAFPIDNWIFNRNIAKAVGKIEADIYEAHAVSGNGFLRALRKRSDSAPFIQTVHGVLADEFIQAKQNRSPSFRDRVANLFMLQLSRLERETARKADFVVTVSHYSKQRIVQLYGVDEEKISVIPNGVDVERFKPAVNVNFIKTKLGLGNRQIVLFVGSLIPRKGVAYLIAAAKTILKEKTDTVFVAVGNGPLRNQLSALVEHFGLSGSFLFLGDVDENSLESLYSCADVFAFPSIQEGQGIALLEAQSSGSPVVAFNVSGVKEAVVDGRSGFLTEVGNSETFAEAILKLLTDKILREKMGRAGREYVSQNFTWDICAQKMLRVYLEAING